MKLFLHHTVIFILAVLITLILLLEASSYYVYRKNFSNSETESNTLILHGEKNFNLMFAGISHARNFSRYRNHERVEKILGRKIINQGQGGSQCGVSEQLFYLSNFYAHGYKVDTILYFLSPVMLYSEMLPHASNTFLEEVFDLRFFFGYLLFPSENKKERTWEYVHSKLTLNWLKLNPDSKDRMTDTLSCLDSVAVKKGFEAAYAGSSSGRFLKSCETIEQHILLAREHHSALIFIIPPALFGHWPGHDSTLAFAKNMEAKYGTRVFDFSESVEEPHYYYDHHHLNTNGVEYFTKTFLKPLLDNE